MENLNIAENGLRVSIQPLIRLDLPGVDAAGYNHFRLIEIRLAS